MEGESDNHPAAIARAFIEAAAVSEERSIYKTVTLVPMKALISLYDKPMPWRVRLYVLVHGVIPSSYQEVEKSHDN